MRTFDQFLEANFFGFNLFGKDKKNQNPRAKDPLWQALLKAEEDEVKADELYDTAMKHGEQGAKYQVMKYLSQGEPILPPKW